MSRRNLAGWMGTLVAALAYLFLAVPMASATEYTWIGFSDNFWGTEGNWSDTGYPQEFDTATFNDLGMVFIVSLGGNQAVDVLNLDALMVSYEINGALTDALTVGTRISQTGLDASILANLGLDADGLDISVTPGTGTLTVSGAIGGTSAGLTKTGAGTLYLSGANTFAAPVIVSAGTLRVEANAALGDAANAITLSGGTLEATRSFVAAHNIAITDAASQIRVAAGKTLLVNGVVSGAEGLTKVGDGTLMIAKDATYGGVGKNLVVNGGLVSGFKPVHFGAAGTGIILDGGGMQITNLNSSTDLGRNIQINTGGGRIDTLNSKNLQMQTGYLTGTGALVKSGNGSFEIKAAGTGIQNTTQTFSGTLTMAMTTTSGGQSIIKLRDSARLLNLAGLTVESYAVFNTDNNGANITDNGTTDLGRLANDLNIVLKGGEFRHSGKDNQSSTEIIGGITLDSRASQIGIQRQNTGGTAELRLIDGITRNVGTTVTVTTGNNGLLGSAATGAGKLIYGTAPTLNDGIMGGWMTIRSDTTGFGYFTNGMEWATYGDNGVATLAAYTLDNIDTVTTADNVKLTSAVTTATTYTMAGSRTVNSLIISNMGTVAGSDINLDIGADNILTVDTGGIIKRGDKNNTISNGTLTAGDGLTASAELFLHASFSGSNNLQINSDIADNGTQVVTVVKDGSGRVKMNGAKTYTGGTIVSGHGALEALSAGSLGTGAVKIYQQAWLDLKASGAIAADGLGGQAGYELFDNAAIYLGMTPSATADLFTMHGNSSIGGNAAQMGGLTQGTNLFADAGTIFAENQTGGNAAVGNLGATPMYYFGLSGGVSDSMAVGAGTPWLGLSSDSNNNRTLSSGTITANSDFVLWAKGTDGGTGRYLYLGNGAGAGNKIIINTPNGPVTVDIVGNSVALNNDVSEFNGVTFAVRAGSTIQTNQLNSMGGGGTADPAKMAQIIVYGGGTLDPGNSAASMNGAITVMPDGRVLLNDGAAYSGTGTITMLPDSILEVSNAATLGGTQPFAFSPGVIVRMNADNITGLSTRVTPAAIYQVNGGDRTENTGITLNGGMLTNDNSGRTLKVGSIVNVTGPSTFASTSGQTLTLASGVVLNFNGNPLTVGSEAIIDGNPKKGHVRFDTAVVAPSVSINTNLGYGLALDNADTNISGDIVINTGVLYLGGGGPSGNLANLTARLTADPALGVAGRVADRILINEKTRVEMGLQTPAVYPASGRLEVTQPFVISGNVNPSDKRNFWISRKTGTVVLPVTLKDITLTEGSVFGVDEDNTDVRASLKLAGNATLTQYDGIDIQDLFRGASLPDYDGTNPVTLTVGRVGDNTAQFNLWGTIPSSVALNVIRGNMYLQAGAVFDSVWDARTAPTGGDSWVTVRGGQDGTTGTIGGTGKVLLGRSVAQNGPEDVNAYVNEVATGLTPLVNRVDFPFEIKSDGNTATTDGLLRADRGTTLNVQGYAYFTNVKLDEGATVVLDQSNNAYLVADLTLQGTGGYINTNNGNYRAHVGNVIGTGSEVLTVGGTNGVTLAGTLMGADVVIDRSAGATRLVGVQGPSTGFLLNDRTLTIAKTTAYAVELWPGCDPGAGTILVNGTGLGFEVRSGEDGISPSLTSATNINVGNGNTLRGFIAQGATQLTQTIGATVTALSDGNAATVDAYLSPRRSDINTAGQGTIPGAVVFENVNLSDGSKTAMIARDSVMLQVGGIGTGGVNVMGNATLLNDASETLVTLGDLTGTGILTLEGGQRWHLNNTVGVGGLNVAGKADLQGTVTDLSQGMTVAVGGELRVLAGMTTTGGLTNDNVAEIDPGVGNTVALGGPVTGKGNFSFKSGTTDLGTTVMASTAPVAGEYVAGLAEGRVANAGTDNINTVDANPGTAIALGTDKAQIVGTGATNGWADYTTFIYTGEVYVANGQIAFAEQFDDTVVLQVDADKSGTFDPAETWLNNATYNTPTTSGTQTLANGWYKFEARFGQGNGGYGPNTGWTIGFGYRTDGVIPSPLVQAGFVAPRDGGTMDLFRTPLPAGVYGNATIDAGADVRAGGFTGFNQVTVNGTLTVTAASTSTTRGLTIAEMSPGVPTGKLDLNTGTLIVDYADTATSPLAQIASWVKAGYNKDAGYWDGNGITSSTAATQDLDGENGPDLLTAIGVVDNKKWNPDLNEGAGGYEARYTEFGGVTVDMTSVLAKYTYWGDANLDGAITFDDYDVIDFYYWFPLPADQMGWWTGDFNMDGEVTFDDYDLIDYAYWFQGTPLSNGLNGVPEPATLALLGLGAVAALARRRRKA